MAEEHRLMSTRVLLMTAVHAGLTFPCPLDFLRSSTVVDMPGHELQASRRSLSKLAKTSQLPDFVVARDIPDLDVRTLRMHVRHGYRPVLVIHASRNPEESMALARGMGLPVPTLQEWTTRMMRIQNIASEFGRLDPSEKYVLYVYAVDGVKASEEAVGALVARALAEPPPDPGARLLPALAKRRTVVTGIGPRRSGTCKCQPPFCSQRMLRYLLLTFISSSAVVLSNSAMLWMRQRANFVLGRVTWVGSVTPYSSRVLIGGCA